MNRIAGILITVFLVPVAMNIITNRTVKSNTSSLNDFCMKPPKETAVIGAVLVIFIGGMVLLSYKNGQLNKLIAFMATSLIILGILLMLLPVKGFWDVTVKNDKVTSSRLWVVSRGISIDSIDHCVSSNNGILVYVRGSDKPVIAIEKMFTNVKNFEKRMDKEGIEIRTE